ncbi:unnamed protein product, partial [Gulo gulo]
MQESHGCPVFMGRLLPTQPLSPKPLCQKHPICVSLGDKRPSLPQAASACPHPLLKAPYPGILHRCR